MSTCQKARKNTYKYSLYKMADASLDRKLVVLKNHLSVSPIDKNNFVCLFK